MTRERAQVCACDAEHLCQPLERLEELSSFSLTAAEIPMNVTRSLPVMPNSCPSHCKDWKTCPHPVSPPRDTHDRGQVTMVKATLISATLLSQGPGHQGPGHHGYMQVEPNSWSQGHPGQRQKPPGSNATQLTD